MISDFDVANAQKQGVVDAESIEEENTTMFQELVQRDNPSTASSPPPFAQGRLNGE